MRRPLALLALVPALAGCAAAAQGSAATTGAGTTTASEHPSVHRSATPVHLTQEPSPASSPSHAAKAGSAVGALFSEGLDHDHDCTATVVSTPSGSVVMTAAHCVSGQASGTVFVPGYDSGEAPYGTWAVTGAYAPDGWLHGTDSDDDVAFLTVEKHGSVTLQQTVGAVTLGIDPVDGESVAITAYNIGVNDQAVQCATKIRHVAQEPTIYCGGFKGGSSGSAWVTTRNGVPTAVGLIGGLHQGGCVDWTSYSPPFGTDETDLLARIGGGGVASEDLPSPPSDGC